MQHVRSFAVTFGALCAALASQASSLIIPPDAATRDGTTVGAFAGFGRKLRQQILIGPEFLAAAVQRELTSLVLRRDGGPHPTGMGRASLTVRLSHSSLADARDARPWFAANRGLDGVIAFQGEVTLPASARPATRDSVTWNAPHVVVIPLTGFVYSGGVLCIEVEGEPSATSPSSWWGIDVEQAGSPGQATVLGNACGSASASIAKTASVDPWRLRVGSSMRLSATAQPHAPAALMIGAAALPVPIDLAFLGAPNCTLSILPDVFLPFSAGPRAGPQWPGFAQAELHLANTASYLGAVLHAQWYSLESSGFATTNGLRLQLSAQPTTLNAAMITSPIATSSFAAHGSVTTGVVPVMELRHRPRA